MTPQKEKSEQKDTFNFSTSNFVTGVKIPAGKNPRVVARAGTTGVARLPERAAKLWKRLVEAGQNGIALPEDRDGRWLVRCILKVHMVRVEVEPKSAKKS